MTEPTKLREKSSENRRRVPRVSVHFPVTVTWGQKQYRWQASELSEFGIFVASKRKELVGEDVQVAMNLEPKGSTLSVGGVVAYATDTGIAVRFKNTSLEQHASLKDYVQAHGIGIEKPS